MVKQLCCFVLGLFLIAHVLLAETEKTETPSEEKKAKEFQHSVVLIQSYQQEHDWLIPWNKKKLQKQNGAALVLPRQRLLTTAELVANHTLIEVRKNGEETPYEAEVVLLDYAVNLALLHVKDVSFWGGLEPVIWGEDATGQGVIQHWKNQREWKNTPANIKNLFIGYRQRSRAYFPIIEVIASVKNGVQGNAVVFDDKVVGMTMQLRDSSIDIFPASFLQAFLKRIEQSPYQGFPQRGFTWQKIPQDTVREYLKIDLKQSGVLVDRVLHYGTGSDVLQPNDFIISMQGWVLSNEGQIDHPKWGQVLFDFLFSNILEQEKTVTLEVIRSGETITLESQLADFPADRHPVPLKAVDQPPRYVLRGGLLFQELDLNYLTLWGKDWFTKAPSRLRIYHQLEAHLSENKDKRLVVLTRVLPSALSIGYQDLHNVIVTKINDQEIDSLSDVVAAFKAPKEGYHQVWFQPGSRRSFLILPDDELHQTDQQILQDFQIPQLEQL